MAAGDSGVANLEERIYQSFKLALEADLQKSSDPNYFDELDAAELAVTVYLGKLEDAQATAAQRLKYQTYVG